MPKHLKIKAHEKYEINGDNVARKNKDCPRCGPGTLLAQHKNRTTCGKCGFSEIQIAK